MNKKIIIIIPAILIIALITIGIILLNKKSVDTSTPDGTLKAYISYINEKKYEEMYELLNENSKNSISKEDFVTRNKNIYEGIDMKNMMLEITDVDKEVVTYTIKMDTSAGEVNFSNTTKFTKNNEKKYEIEWTSNMIFPNLNNDDKVRIKTTLAKRGDILDRNGNMLAGEGSVSSIGLVPGKMSSNKDTDIAKIAELLDITVEGINKELSASYVKDDTFVPIKKVSMDNTALKEKLLQIPGIKITSVDSRVYPLADATSHLTGYVQSITAEELEKYADKNYSSTSVIGKLGIEKQYEDRLRGKDGIRIYIEDKNGTQKDQIAVSEAKDGENIKLTIDSDIQKKLYNELKDDKGLFVVMHPKTGELLALVSTPSYDANDFVLGMSTNKWNSLNEDLNKPMLNRFLQTWSPGSTFKPITGAVGITTGKLSATDEFSYSGLAWQKDASWGNYKITTLTAYSRTKNLKNALIHSDNIYFAQAALQIGKETFMDGLKKLGFDESLGLELPIYKSQFANDGLIDTEIGLADSGYGQGQILVNPIHMASMYSAFANDGNMVKPYIEYKEGKAPEYLKENVFTKEAANIVKEGLIQIVEDTSRNCA